MQNSSYHETDAVIHEQRVPMTFAQYQDSALMHAMYPHDPWTVEMRGGHAAAALYPFFKLSGEVGEVLEKVGKIIRDEQGIISVDKREELLKELGDVLWYVCACADELDCSLEDVARGNVTKLQSRAERGKLQGSGDNR